MSFLNPVNEPVLRFKSTDAGAPQVNYNSRAAGDVKAVLKACLVTGYGSVASAGWSIVNEVGNVVEFVSPSAAMSDYRLGIDDNSTTKVQWYTAYQTTTTKPTNTNLDKVISNINKTSPSNGWQLLVTDRGVIFIETLYSNTLSNLMTQVTHWGSLKVNVDSFNGEQIALWSVGVKANAVFPTLFFADTARYATYRMTGFSGLKLAAANIDAAKNQLAVSTGSAEMIGPVFINDTNGNFIAQQPAILLRTDVNVGDYFGVSDTTMDGRPVVSVFLGGDVANLAQLSTYGKHFLIYLDYWEY